MDHDLLVDNYFSYAMNRKALLQASSELVNPTEEMEIKPLAAAGVMHFKSKEVKATESDFLSKDFDFDSNHSESENDDEIASSESVSEASEEKIIQPHDDSVQNRNDPALAEPIVEATIEEEADDFVNAVPVLE